MDLKEKRVLVFGTGKSGIGAAELLEDMGSIPVLYDGNEKTDPAEVKSRLKEGTKAEVFIGNLPEKEIDKLSLVVLSRCSHGPSAGPSFKEKGLKISGARWSWPTLLEKATCWPSREPMEKRQPPAFWEPSWSMRETPFSL